MAGWSGFTEEDLLRLKRDSEGDIRQNQKRHNSKQQRISTQIATDGDEKKIIKPQQQNRRKMPLKQEKGLHTKETDKIEMPHDRGISKVTDVFIDKQEKSKTLCSSSGDLQVPMEASLAPSTNIFDDNKRGEEPDLKPIADEEVAEIELNNLVNLQKKQKEIEEENKKKKLIISNTISQRYKKAQHEASTLQYAQKELVALDCLLAKDVEILRTKIEEATSAFSTAKRRYDKAEKEFVNAKLDLKLKSDIKEELTQHLYTIIQENELRKSKKLEELMSKLNVAENVTVCDSSEDHPAERVDMKS